MKVKQVIYIVIVLIVIISNASGNKNGGTNTEKSPDDFS